MVVVSGHYHIATIRFQRVSNIIFCGICVTVKRICWSDVTMLSVCRHVNVSYECQTSSYRRLLSMGSIVCKKNAYSICSIWICLVYIQSLNISQSFHGICAFHFTGRTRCFLFYRFRGTFSLMCGR